MVNAELMTMDNRKENQIISLTDIMAEELWQPIILSSSPVKTGEMSDRKGKPTMEEVTKDRRMSDPWPRQVW